MPTRGEQRQNDVLAILQAARAPLSAYDVMGHLRQGEPKIAPPTVYRALNTLADRGLIHRLESLNAYIACQHDGAHHVSVLSICDECGAVQEDHAPRVEKELSSVASQNGFLAHKHVIELHGSCADCTTDEVRP